MNRLLRTLISAFIVLSLVLSCCITSFSYEAEKNCPYIYVHGFMAKDIIADKNNPDSETVWPPASDRILNTVKECLPALARFLIDRNYEKLGDAIIDPVNELLSGANLDLSGNASDGSGVYFEYPPAESITPSSHLNFRYDWRLDPIELAAQLNDFIDYVLAASGSSQVVIECHSFGGIVTEAYTQLYGGEKIKSVCYNTSAIFGESYTGLMMSGNIVIDADSVTEYLKCMLSENDRAEIIGALLDLLNDAGVTDDLADILNGIVENLGEELIREILLPMFAGWLSIWAMIPDNLYKDDGIDHSGLREKIDNYNSTVRPFKTQTLQRQNETTNFYVISRYGYTSIPLTERWEEMTDTVVDTKYSSFGGTCADYGKKLDEQFIVQYKDSGYMNAECTVYSGTCLFPEQTWFIRELMHSKSPDALESMTETLLYYPGQADIHTFDIYPQFLHYTASDGTMLPDTGTPETEETVIQKLFGYYRKLIRFIRSILDFSLLRRIING